MCVGVSREAPDTIGYGLESYTDKNGTIRFRWDYGHYFNHAPEATHAPAIEQFREEVQAIVWVTDEFISYTRTIYRREF